MSHSTVIITKPPSGGGLVASEGAAHITVTYSPVHDPEEAAKQFNKLQRLTDKVLAVANGSSEE